jgi:hypothetical protein
MAVGEVNLTSGDNIDEDEEDDESNINSDE